MTERPNCCHDFARTWEETQGGKLPPSNHAPTCPNYKLKRFVKVTLKDDPISGYVETLEDAERAAYDPAEYIVSGVLMTQDQIEKLKEFSGF